MGQRRRGKSRWVWRVAACLLVGAGVNVAAAWGLAAFSAMRPWTYSKTGGAHVSTNMGGYQYHDELSASSGGVGWDVRGHESWISRESYWRWVEWRAGWPLRSLRAVHQPDHGSESLERGLEDPAHGFVRGVSLGGGRRLPLIPVWPGFLVNSVLFASVVLAGTVVLGAWRRARRRSAGCCPACCYPVGASPVCSECGEPVQRGGAA